MVVARLSPAAPPSRSGKWDAVVVDGVARKSSSHAWLRSLVAAVVAATASACTGGDTITLGAALQLTGNLAGTGRYYRDAYQFAIDRINERGGVTIGEFNYRLALKVRDTQSDVNRGVRLQEELITKDRVNFLLGPYSSNDVIAGSSVAEKYQVPMVQGGGAASRIFARGYRYVFGTLPAAEEYFRSTIEMMQRLTPRPRTVGMVMGDDPFDIALAQGTLALLQRAGMEVVLQQQYSERTPNFYNIITLLQSRTPDVLLWSGHEAGAINFIRQSKSRNVNPNLLASFTVAVSTANFRSTLGNDANYAFGMTPWLPSERLKDRWFGDANEFATAFEERFGYAPDYHVAAAVAAVQTLVFAIEAARTFDSDNVRDAIAKLDFESLYGRIRFGDDGQIVMPQTVIQIQGGQVVEIFTDKQMNEPLYPVPPWDRRR
jgi:branched-chain amino acid transport system substrate-binding protein